MKKIILLILIISLLPIAFSFKYLNSELSKSQYYQDEMISVRLIIDNPTNEDFRGKISFIVAQKEKENIAIPIEYDINVPKGKEYIKIFDTKEKEGEYSVIINLIDINGMIVDSQRLEFMVLLGEKKCKIDGFCIGDENYGTCPNDCKSGMKDNYCDMVIDKICDPDCENKDLDCKIKENEQKKVIIYLILLVVLIVIIFYIIKIEKSKIKNKK